MTEAEIQEIKDFIESKVSVLIVECSRAGNGLIYKYNKKEDCGIYNKKRQQIDTDINSLKAVRHLALNSEIDSNIAGYFKKIIAKINHSEYLKTVRDEDE